MSLLLCMFMVVQILQPRLVLGYERAAESCSCGPFTYPVPHAGGMQPGPLVKDTDIPGNDMSPCGPDGCNFQGKTIEDCALLCNQTRGCVAYVRSVTSDPHVSASFRISWHSI